MMKLKTIALVCLFVPFFWTTSFGYTNTNFSNTNKAEKNFKVLAGDCDNSTKTQIELSLNNVRTTIFNRGDWGWDGLRLPRYEIPKGGGIHSLFTSALWIGGIDAGGQLKVAAMTYRQSGVDFWPGPLGTSNSLSEVDKSTCDQYDKLYRITRKEVEEYYGWMTNPNDFPDYSPPTSILEWPGNIQSQGLTQGEPLAPFFDGDGNLEYNPSISPQASNFDYPAYNITNTSTNCDDELFGDETIFWVFNDKGNIHTETGGQPIGLEIRAQAFAFATNDEISDMTFFTYKIINRSSFSLTKTYFGQWTDPDLGVCNDDFVGCDVGRGLGYCYNGDEVDDNVPRPCSGELGYGANPPAIGMDFFRGPKADENDGIDNNRNGAVDEADEQIIMSKFVYYNNTNNQRGNPVVAADFYGYLSGKWKDGLPLTYGGDDGYNDPGPACDFMFPGDSDPTGWGTGGDPQSPWSETVQPDDRRFLQSAGPFTLRPGAVNVITVGVVWARANSGGNLASVEKLKLVDDKAQNLFDNCFKVLNGPDAPDIGVQEYDREVTLYLSNKASTSNNYLEAYTEYDPAIFGFSDTNYIFQGYHVFQLKDASVSSTDLFNADKARLVAHCDMKDSVEGLVNFIFDPTINALVGQEQVKLAEESENVQYNKGIVHSFKITKDAFATGDNKLVNHKTYYFMAIAYGYNNFKPYRQDVAPDTSNLSNPAYDGQKLPCKYGRKNIKIYTVIPHNTMPEGGGTIQSTLYGDGVKLTRIEGQGNGGNALEFTDETVEAILNSAEGRVLNPEYKAGKGPVNIKIVDPLAVPNADFEFKLNGVSFDSGWTLTNKTTGQTVSSLQSIQVANEQLIPEWGLSITIKQLEYNPGDTIRSGEDYFQPDEVFSYESTKNGVIENGSEIVFTDATKNWLSSVNDIDGYSPFNWIRSGKQVERTATGETPNRVAIAYDDYDYVFNTGTTRVQGYGVDNNQEYEKVLAGAWGPYRLCGVRDHQNTSYAVTAAPADVEDISDRLKNNWLAHLASTMVVITPDKTKWTRCVVLEMQDYSVNAEGGAERLSPRRHASVDKNGNVGDGVASEDPNDADYISGTGMGWFPGYALNLETGERLNMAFGENSFDYENNGKDMLWNPTSNLVKGVSGSFEYVFGGRHYIYVFGHNRDNFGTSSADPMRNRLKGVPRYDAGRHIFNLLNDRLIYNNSENVSKGQVFGDAMWVNIPLLNTGHTLLESEVKIFLRVAKAYMKGYSTGTYSRGVNGSEEIGASVFATYPFVNGFRLATDTSTSPQNNNLPMYTFSTKDIAAVTNDGATAKSALDLINVVPNPYYAYSNYETSQLDNRIKITNLPEKCTVSIYTPNGGLIRKYQKDDTKTSLDWDLKNQAGIPVASGLYMIHINAGNAGEKLIKWFGVTRPPDLDSY